jgi:formylglycine-generating enzyme required for sulfatase activity
MFDNAPVTRSFCELVKSGRPFREIFGEECLLVRVASELGSDSLSLQDQADLRDVLAMFEGQVDEGLLDVSGQVQATGVPEEQLRYRTTLKALSSLLRSLCVKTLALDEQPLLEAAGLLTQVFGDERRFPTPNRDRRQEDLRKSDALYACFHNVLGDSWNSGGWAAWDFVCRARHRSGNPSIVAATRQGAFPLLLYVKNTKVARVARLHIELIAGEEAGFWPSLWNMGATVIRRVAGEPDGWDPTREPHELDFMASMARAWTVSGLGDRNMRGRWWVGPFEPLRSHRRAPDPIPWLEGRSGEVAAYCLLRALAADPNKPLRLDEDRPITATITRHDVLGGSTRWRPGQVDYVPEKVRAALRNDLAGPVVVAQETVDALQASGKLDVDLQRNLKPFDDLEEAFESLLAMHRLRRTHATSTAANWTKRWRADSALPENKETQTELPPFIATQGIKLLMDERTPLRHLTTDAFRSQREKRTEVDPSPAHEPEPWELLPTDERSYLSRGEITIEGRSHSLRRIFITSDAGLGKSTTVEWLEYELNRHDSGLLAIRMNLSDLEAGLVSLPNGEIAPFLTLLVHELTVHADAHCLLENGEAAACLRRLREQGRLCLLFDGLDEVDADSPVLMSLREMMNPESLWKDCRIVIAGRPYAITTLSDQLFSGHLSAGGWRFLVVDEFTSEQQREYLGDEHYEAVPEDAREILTVPRVLFYLRKYVSDPKQIRSASDVYWTAVRRITEEGLKANAASGLDFRDALLIIAAFAFELTIERGTFEPVRVNELESEVASDCQSYTESRVRPGRKSPTQGRDWLTWVQERLPCLAATNGPFKHDLLESGSLGRIQFRNRSLQEFFAAFWMSNYCLEDQVQRLWERLPLAHDAASQAWYWTFRFAAEMPDKALDATSASARSDEHWILAMSAVFRPGDGTATGTKRASEIIVRAWPTLHDKYYERDKNPAAIAVVDAWRGEFQAILDSKEDSPRRHAAEELTQSFVDFPGGEFKMGSPTSDRLRYDNEPVELPLTLGPFSLCRFPMLNSFYRLYDPGHGLAERSYNANFPYSRVSPGERHPAIYTSWWDARAASLWFRWRDANSNSGWLEATLPNEAQHEYVARRGQKTYEQCWWGSSFLSQPCLGMQDLDYESTAALPQWLEGMNHPRLCQASVFDIADNVWTWCLNVYRDRVSSLEDVTELEGGPHRSFRGTGWGVQDPRSYRSAIRRWEEPGGPDYNFFFGFRLALVRSG